ncbi:MAG: MerR family transcriptional regulator [Chloroflexota bacterium]
MYTIGKLVKEFELSRSTLLYYDRIGLLKPSARTEADYRVYSEQDFNRMSKIALYKKAGLSLEAIAEILDSADDRLSNILEQRLESLNSEMNRIRQQQRFILQLLGKDSLLKNAKAMNTEQWIKILEDSGMDHAAMHQWHVEFERHLPEAHRDFLEALGMSKAEIEAIKASAQKAITPL